MPNANIPMGFIPRRHVSGAPFNGQGNVYYVPASYGTSLFVGDPVIVVNNSADARGVPTVQRATAGGGGYTTGIVMGVVDGGEPIIPVTRDTPVYHAANTAGYVMVCDDPEVLFEIQEDSVGGALAAGAASRNADFIAGAGSTATGKSGFMLDSSTLQTTNTLQLRIIAPVERIDNELGAYAKWLVQINLHSLRNLTGV